MSSSERSAGVAAGGRRRAGMAVEAEARSPWPAHQPRSAGASSRHSSTPAWGASSSVTAPSGQPPPGSSASSAAKPLGSVGALWAPRLLPRHSRPCRPASSSSGGRGGGGGVKAFESGEAGSMVGQPGVAKAKAGGRMRPQDCVYIQYL
ncbi:MAG: hypothetical protein C0460_14755 [Methylibium sp.]|nr:hypothetical protein [Methylibium sp.]